MAPELEEIIRNAHRTDVENFFPDPDQASLNRVPRHDQGDLLQPVFRSREGFPVELSVRSHGQRVQHYERRRHHVLGQFLTQELCQLRLAEAGV